MKRLRSRDAIPGDVDRVNLRAISLREETAVVNCVSDYLDRTELWWPTSLGSEWLMWL